MGEEGEIVSAQSYRARSMCPSRVKVASRVKDKRAGTSPVNAVVRGTTVGRQVHFQSSN